VQSGLAPGEQLIVSGLQKIRDGAPVMAAPPAGAAPQAPKAPKAPKAP
jgi:membrane fusion protein (multidrug efflux system)